MLLLVSLKDRKYRFEVGRGIEPILNDAKIGRVGRTYLVENFKSGNYEKGIYEATLAVKTTLLGETDSMYYVKETSPIKVPVRSFISLFFFMMMLMVVMSRMRSRRIHGKSDDYFNAAFMAAVLFGGRGRGGSGGGFGGGGFGGFGGGGFGGGGASGGW